MKLSFHHIGMATRDITSSVALMKSSGVCEILSDKVDDPVQKCSLQMINWNGAIIELISPIGTDSPVEYILKNGTSIYHVCFTTDEMEPTINEFRALGYVQATKTTEAKLFLGDSITFMFHPMCGLIELLETTLSR